MRTRGFLTPFADATALMEGGQSQLTIRPVDDSPLPGGGTLTAAAESNATPV